MDIALQDAAVVGAELEQELEEEEDEAPSLVQLLKDQARLRKLIDPEGLFTSKTSKDYLERVSNLSLEALEQEPKIIHEEASFVSGELTSLCFREYRTFITVHQCSSQVHTAFASFTESLDSLLDAVPSLEAECHAFAASTKQTQSDRRKASLLLEHHDKLLDLLEVPQLLETCVRNGYYHEAMELGQHAKEMSARYGEVAIVRDVEKEVEKGLMGMLVKLLGVLREQVKLPALVKAVGFLRRMDVLNEEELQVAFLASREHNFRAVLVGIERERGEPVRYVRRYVDLFRENVYDVISQFTTIFLDYQKHQLSLPPLPDSKSNLLPPSSSPSSPPPPTLLITFAHQSLSALLTLLETHIPLIEDPSALSSLLTQLNYCATSFARVGLDFRSLVTEPFERAVVHSVTKSLKEAEAGLEGTLRGALRNGKMPSTWMMPPESISFVLDLDINTSTPFLQTNNTSKSNSTPSIHSPPIYLTHFPDLALLCNGHINTLNSLRLLSPLSLFPTLLTLQLQSLSRSASLLLSYSQSSTSEFASLSLANSSSSSTSTPGVGGRPGHRRNASVSAGPSDKDKKETKLVLRAFGRAFVDGMVPFVRKGLVEGVFGGELGSLEEVDERVVAVGGGGGGGGKKKKEEGGIDKLREWVESVEAELRPPKEEEEEEVVVEKVVEKEEGKKGGGSTREPSSSVAVPDAVMEEPEEMEVEEEEVVEEDGKGEGEQDLKEVDEEIRELEESKEKEVELEGGAKEKTEEASS
ncbi:Dor1-like family-domain-containing protein [Mrakia frigida]|uniref:Dor1-like family-domain-containing protein n=1 Tax=Mrakia frigida TaxID=29902 RepID=UPI003FCBF461